jgi:hypothetical protein
MMGAATGQQDRHFYEFNPENLVLPDHLLCRIDTVQASSPWLN